MHPYTDRGNAWGKCRGKHSPEISLILPKIHLRSLKFRTRPSEAKSGAENETRTRDPDLGKVVLYQLSYFRDWECKGMHYFSKSKFFSNNFIFQLGQGRNGGILVIFAGNKIR